MTLITTCAVMHVGTGESDPDTGKVCAGHCPACHQAVWFEDESDGPVWTCPADLNPDNPHHVDDPVDEAEKARAGVYSDCRDDHGGGCPHDAMPLHSECYGTRPY